MDEDSDVPPVLLNLRKTTRRTCSDSVCINNTGLDLRNPKNQLPGTLPSQVVGP
jgi:hypothetical protein